MLTDWCGCSEMLLKIGTRLLQNENEEIREKVGISFPFFTFFLLSPFLLDAVRHIRNFI